MEHFSKRIALLFHTFTHSWLASAAVAIALVIVGGAFLLSGALGDERFSPQNAAEQIIARCAETAHIPTCYNEEIPKLARTHSLEEVFAVVRFVQDEDSEFAYCHLLGHELGEREVAKDPNRWMEVVTKCPTDGICANGCLHGALVQRFADGEISLSSEQIKAAVPDLQQACEPRDGWNPTPLDKAICYHGLGHLSVYITGADFQRSLSLCDSLARKEDGSDHTGVCYEGVFMQLFQPIEPEDELLVADTNVTKENLVEFCGTFSTQEKRQACFSEGWPLFSDEFQKKGGVERFCALSDNPRTERHCYEMVFHVLAQSADFNPARINRSCELVSEPLRSRCIADAARAMVQADPRFINQAVEFCRSASKENVVRECFLSLSDYATYRFHPHSPEASQLCELLPADYQHRCGIRD